MISPLRATAIIGAGTFVTLVTSVVVAKALALLVGPEGVGRYGLLHSVLGLAVILVGLGVNTAIVRELAAALAQSDALRVAAVRRAGLILAIATGILGAVAFFLLRDPIAALALGSSDRAVDIAWLAMALLLQLVAGAELAVINGYHRIRSLTIAAVMTSALGAALTVVLVATLGQAGIPISVLVSALIAALVAIAIRVRSVGGGGSTDRVEFGVAAGRLLQFGAPFTASQLAGTGAVLLVPILILTSVGTEGVGYFRAAASISLAYMAFLLNAMAQDYLPRAAGAAEEDLSGVIERQTRILVALAAPVILAVLALAPVVVYVLYSDEFALAAEPLQWQLVADLLRLPAWALSFVLLARASFARFVTLEFIGGASLVVSILLLTPLMGLPGTGMAFTVTYAVYYVAAWMLVRAVAPVIPGRVQLSVIGLSFGCIAVLIVMPEATLVRGSIFGAAAVGVATVAWPRLWRHHRAGQLR